jgi:hypothetical protein
MITLAALSIILTLQGAPSSKVSVTMTGPAIVGKAMKGVIKLTIPDGFHAYANPPSSEYLIPVKLSLDGKVFGKLAVTYPVGTPMTVVGEDKPVAVYEGTVSIPFSVIPSKAGKQSLKLRLESQLCDDHACLPPATSAIVVNTVVKKS